MRALLALVSIALAAGPAAARQIVTSPAPEAVSLTVYRAPSRGDGPIDKNWPQGYALITETRTIRIPAGESLIRFEGVAEGLYPETAIVTGLPRGVREKNRDARLLSPAGLVDAYLKRQVIVARTDKATGKTVESSALVTAGPNGGVILQTEAGYEALRCTGLPERMRYGGAPEGLSARPTLSVITTSDRAVTARVVLTYMAAGFDWQANYVMNAAKLAPGQRLDLDVFAWLTIANGGNQSFDNAQVMAIAGRPNRIGNAPLPKGLPPALTLQCWPMQRTDQVPFRKPYGDFWNDAYPIEAGEDSKIMLRMSAVPPVMAAPLPPPMAAPAPVMVAQQEDLGDLKLYRVPEPVSVNAKGQKQVAMIVKPGAKFERLYTGRAGIADGESRALAILLRGENKAARGLGLPMPSGQVMLFENSDHGPLLAGETTLRDRAVGDEVELTVGASGDVRYRFTQLGERGKQQSYRLEISNARAEPVNVEIRIPFELAGYPKGVSRIDGLPTWKVSVAANGEASLLFDAKLQ